MRVFQNRFVYWDVESAGLCEHRFWKTKAVPWEEITQVSGFFTGKHPSLTITVDYSRSAPMSDRGHILADPEDRDQFIAALRRYAPNASFDVWP